MRVIERHLTLCGETHLAGTLCALIRFAGCDLDCRWCDTPHAREPDGGETLTPEQLVTWSRELGARLVLLTGGEPLLQADLPRLTSMLAAGGHQVLVETSGACDIAPLAAPVVRCVDVKCPSSGAEGRMRWENLSELRPDDAVKFVIADRADYDYAADVIQRHGLGGRVNILLSSAHPQLSPRQLATWMTQDLKLGRRWMADVRLNVQLHHLWPQLERR